MPKEYFAKKGNKKSGGGPFRMKSYGQGKSPLRLVDPVTGAIIGSAITGIIGAGTSVAISSAKAKEQRRKQKEQEKKDAFTNVAGAIDIKSDKTRLA